MQLAAALLTMWMFISGVSTTQDDARRVRQVLDKQVADWNAGQLEAFMQGYWHSQSLTFFSGGRKLAGWDTTLDRYRKAYQADGHEMGKLAFSDLDVTMLGPAAAMVTGHWELTLSDGKKPGGVFTLIFRKLDGNWKIVHDHTSNLQ